MNATQLKDKIKNISKQKGVDFNILLRLYMYDRFIERLSISKYKDNFIIKGGFYLSTLFGIESRSTMDIDTSFKNANFNKDTIIKMFKEIISIKINDNSKLTYVKTSKIRDDDEYGGYRVEIMVEFENIKEKFHVDVATGDPITPKEIVYKYKPILNENYINLWAYNIETVLAEKIETILSRVELNGRMRDFYDVYLIYTRSLEKLNINNLKKSIKNTFYKRQYNGNPVDTIKIIRNSDLLRKNWRIYNKKYDYAKNIEFDEILNCIEELIKHCEFSFS